MEHLLAHIRARLRSPTPKEREAALDELGELNPPDALTSILPLLSDPDQGVRETAAFTLGEIHDQRAIPYLLTLAAHAPEDSVRIYATEALGNYHDPRIQALLINAIARPESSPRLLHTIARQLRHYPSPVVLTALVDLLHRADARLAITIVDALSQMNQPALDATWHNLLLEADHAYLQKVAAEGLAHLRGIPPFDFLTALLQDDRSNVQQSVLTTLAQFDHPQVMPILLEYTFTHPDAAVRDAALQGLAQFTHPDIYAVLIALLDRGDLSDRAREMIADQLSTYTSDDSVAHLVLLLDDPDEAVRTTAATSLYRLNRASIAAVWRDHLDDTHPYIRQLAHKALSTLTQGNG